MTGPLLDVEGTIVIREHCAFHWRQAEPAYQRIVDVERHHCARCVYELGKQSGFILHDLRPRPAQTRGGGR